MESGRCRWAVVVQSVGVAKSDAWNIFPFVRRDLVDAMWRGLNFAVGVHVAVLERRRRRRAKGCLRVRARVSVCVYVCICAYVCMHACMYVCMYVCMLCVRVCARARAGASVWRGLGGVCVVCWGYLKAIARQVWYSDEQELYDKYVRPSGSKVQPTYAPAAHACIRTCENSRYCSQHLGSLTVASIIPPCRVTHGVLGTAYHKCGLRWSLSAN